MLSAEQREEAHRLFRAHGYEEPLRVARITSEDERIFVIAPAALNAVPLETLTRELQAALGRKVWIVPEGSGWSDTQELS